MFFARKRSANAASATCFVCAKAKRQHVVGHSVVATARGVLRLGSSFSADDWTTAEKS
ncbi:hypothetical protein ABNX05_19035 [Lysinibacillus sp. M3]|uniref:Uncharacterized protein n=1 Tax=Lysinibacillus zambalensis TaxID=3160866 RepID=A0ABV1MW34_9BACI